MPVFSRSLATPRPPPLRSGGGDHGGGSIGSDMVNGLKGLFTLPPNFRKYQRWAPRRMRPRSMAR